MKKRIIIPIIVIILLFIISLLVFTKKHEEKILDENTLYSIKLNETIIRIQRYDYAIGQNQIVGVEKSIDNGKTFERVTDEPITISMEPKFSFLDEDNSFIISKSNLSKSNEYLGFKVTRDGGKTFTNGIINYDNPGVDILTIVDVPYQNYNKLVLPCAIYKIKEDQSGYENVNISFISIDNGLTWNVDDRESDNVNNINVTINGIKYVANLEDNETVKSFISLLPKEFNMQELNGNEKYVYLDNNLPINTYSPKHINKGDIMLYGNNCLVIFYKSFDTSYSYTKIGHIDNLNDLGNDSVLVKIER